MQNDQDWLILVDNDDIAIGHAKKIYAHQRNLLHRAFSIMIVDRSDPSYCLLQKRQDNKYHCPGLWTNTCCSHPYPNESTQDAAQRRLQQELGLNIALTRIGSFSYQASFENGLHEHEFDHVFVGEFDRNLPINANPDEISELEWLSFNAIMARLARNPSDFTPWLHQVLSVLATSLNHARVS